MLAMALFAHAYARRDRQSDILFHLSMACFLAAAGILSYYSARYNERNPASPIRLWMRGCCGAVLAFLIGAYNVYAAADNFNCFLFFLLSAFLAGTSGYYYAKDRSRILPKYYD
jgi:hypothetical protein